MRLLLTHSHSLDPSSDTLLSRVSVGHPCLMSLAHWMGEHTIFSKSRTTILPLRLKYHHSDQCLQFWEGSTIWKTDFHWFQLQSYGGINTQFIEASNNLASADVNQGSSSIVTLPQVPSLLPSLTSHQAVPIDEISRSSIGDLFCLTLPAIFYLSIGLLFPVVPYLYFLSSFRTVFLLLLLCSCSLGKYFDHIKN